MPLRCLDEHDASVHAFLLDASAWEALAALNRTTRSLRTTCCAARVSLKRSALGTQFFAHVGRGGCTTGDESPEHLALKQIAIDAARARGWQAEAEVAAADGSWRADVLATRGSQRVAVEVQWSPQTDDETRRRHAQLAAAGVRTLWLFRQRGFPVDAELPALRVAGRLADGFTIAGVDAATVMRGVFDRRLSFGFPLGAIAQASVIGGVGNCWGRDCGALNRVVAAIEIRYAASRCTLKIEDIPLVGTATRTLVAALQRGEPYARVRARGGGTVGLSNGNGCFRCDLALGPRDIPAATHVPLLTVALRVDEALGAVLAQHASASLAWGVAATRVAPQPPSR